jgi:hypothetical protein
VITASSTAVIDLSGRRAPLERVVSIERLRAWRDEIYLLRMNAAPKALLLALIWLAETVGSLEVSISHAGLAHLASISPTSFPGEFGVIAGLQAGCHLEITDAEGGRGNVAHAPGLGNAAPLQSGRCHMSQDEILPIKTSAS